MSDSDAAFAVEFDECLKKLKIKISELNLEITPDSITTVIKLAMELAEASKLKGEAQKKLVTKISRELEEMGQSEIQSSVIGKIVMNQLKEIDKIAYIRFASVYTNFKEVKEFEEYIEELDGKQK